MCTNTYSSPPTVLSTASSNTIEADKADQQATAAAAFALPLFPYQYSAIQGTAVQRKGMTVCMCVCECECATVLNRRKKRSYKRGKERVDR